MRPRLPPLNALRAFEAAARHLSFTKAADELNVTQAAISHQVKTLEADLGLRLFRRLPRRLLLSEEGRTLLPAVSEGLDAFAAGVARLRGGAASRSLSVSVTPSFGIKFLAPRLGRFLQRHGEIDLRLHHSTTLVDFTRDEVDLAVRYGRGVWDGLEATYLLEAGLTPLCSPRLLEGDHPLRTPEDLAHHSLLHERDSAEWEEWLLSNGVTGVDGRRGPVIADAATRYQAAVEGYGVVLSSLSLHRQEIAEGLLAQPFDLQWQGEAAYYIVALPGTFEQPKCRTFRDFLLAEAAEGAHEGA